VLLDDVYALYNSPVAAWNHLDYLTNLAFVVAGDHHQPVTLSDVELGSETLRCIFRSHFYWL
jgi:hypothetical protein